MSNPFDLNDILRQTGLNDPVIRELNKLRGSVLEEAKRAMSGNGSTGFTSGVRAQFASIAMEQEIARALCGPDGLNSAAATALRKSQRTVAEDLGAVRRSTTDEALKGLQDSRQIDAFGELTAEAVKQAQASKLLSSATAGSGLFSGNIISEPKNVTAEMARALHGRSGIAELTRAQREALGRSGDMVPFGVTSVAARLASDLALGANMPRAVSELLAADRAGVSSSLADHLNRNATGQFSSLIDSVVGAQLGRLRPGFVGDFKAAHGRLLGISAYADRLRADLASDRFASRTVDQLSEFAAALGSAIDPLTSILAASRSGDPRLNDVVLRRALAEEARYRAGLNTALDELGGYDQDFAKRLLAFLGSFAKRLASNTKAEVQNGGLIFYLSLLCTFQQLSDWITPDPAVDPAAVSRIEQSQANLHAQYNRLIDRLGDQEADNLATLPRAVVRRPAWVRAGPGKEFARRTRLEAGVVIAAREQEGAWRLVFYRDPTTGAAASGWIYAPLLEML